MSATDLLAHVSPASLRPPHAIVLGAPRAVAGLADALGEATCYQMDDYLAGRLADDLAAGSAARVRAAPDLWDLPAEFETAIYPAPHGGERALNLDMVEQAFHILRPGGTLVVLSPYAPDQVFAPVMKKVFGKVRTHAAGAGTVLAARRTGDRPRRRHEVVFHARVGDGPSLRFVSRPGTFAYGRFDDGARALVETMTVVPGDRVLDVGCGCGTNGVFASRLGGVVTFVDSNHRAVTLAEINARANGVTDFRTVVTSRLEGLPPADFDVALANPPYFAQESIARLFVDGCRALLRPSGRFYLVTRQPEAVEPFITAAFGRADAVSRRGYVVFRATAPSRPAR